MKINQLKTKFEKTISIQKNHNLTSDEKIQLEEHKLALMKQFEKELITNLAHLKGKIKEKKEKQKKFLLLRKAFYYFLIVFGLIENAIGSYIFGLSLLSLITFLPNPVLVVGSIIFAILNGVLFYAFDASLMREAIGIPENNKERHSLIQSYIQQIEILNNINKLLFDVKSVAYTSTSAYQEYAQLALILNKDLAEKQNFFGTFEESLPKKILRWTITGFGALSVVASSYFFATSILALVSASLLSNPIGWVIIGCLILSGLGYYFSMQGTSMIDFVNPEYSDYKALKKNLKKIEFKEETDFQVIFDLQQRLEQTEVQHKSTGNSEQKEAPAKEPYHPKAQLSFFPSLKENPDLPNFVYQPATLIP